MIKTIAAGCFAVAALVTAQCAAAADLSVAPLYKAPPPPAMAPAYNWSGFYLGINGGGGWGHSNWNTSSDRIGLSGGLAGGTAGYNWQIGSAVLGLEGDIDWANLKGTNSSTLCPLGCSTSDTWLSTVRGRAGYAFGNVLPYVTGGLAVGDIRAATPGFPGASNTSAGWTAGAGIEGALAGNWTAKLEYLYLDLGTASGAFTTPLIAPGGALVSSGYSSHFTDNILRIGVNYKFGGATLAR